MKSVNFKEVTHEIAKEQEEYNSLFSQWNPEEMSVNVCFELEDQEVAEINRTKKIWYKQQTFGNPMNPMRLSPFKNQMIQKPKEIDNMEDVDMKTPEGKMLISALAILSSENPEMKLEDLIQKVKSLTLK